MTSPTNTSFQDQYLQTWTEPNAEARCAIIGQVWAADGRMVVAPAGTTVEGVSNIADHIGRVHDDLIAGKGLQFVYDQQIDADDTLLLRWSMLTPAGDAVGRGVDVISLDSDGQVQTVYMFMGVN